MKIKLFLISFIIVIVSILISIFFIYFTKTDGKLLNVEYQEECNLKPNLYYEGKNYKIYTICLKNIKVRYNIQEVELSYYLDKNRNIFEITMLLDKSEDNFKNTIYTNDLVKIIECKNKDIYILNSDIEYQDNFCK